MKLNQLRPTGCLAALAITILTLTTISEGQIAGGSTYNPNQVTGRAGALSNEKAKHTISPGESPANPNELFIEANILANVLADEYVAVLGVNTEGVTIEECQTKADEIIRQLRAEFKKIGVSEKETAVDFVNQNRTYAFDIAGDTAKEKQVGFELRKNISIKVKSRQMVEMCLSAASKVGIYDLIKVDYIVTDLSGVQERLMADATAVIKKKELSYNRLLGIQSTGTRQVLAEKYATYMPTDLYDSYRAFESEEISNTYRSNVVVRIRKPRTFYYNGLDARWFDQVSNPALLEPAVQFSLYLKVRVNMTSQTTSSPPAKPSAPAKRQARKRTK